MMGKIRKIVGIAMLIAIMVCGMSCSRGDGKADKCNCKNDTVAALDSVAKAFSEPPVKLQKTVNLNVYYPDYTNIDLVCGTMPSKDDKSVIMMGAAAFTQECLDEFAHSNIIEDHVSGGQWYDGPDSKRCTGTFVYYDGKPHFYYKDNGAALKTATAKGGAGFKQEMMIHADTIVPHTRADDNKNEFRALCMVDGKLAIIDSNKAMKFGDFINSLKALGVFEALYMDMGGWDYSWYREENGEVNEIHPSPTQYGTNWLTFYW